MNSALPPSCILTLRIILWFATGGGCEDGIDIYSSLPREEMFTITHLSLPALHTQVYNPILHAQPHTPNPAHSLHLSCPTRSPHLHSYLHIYCTHPALQTGPTHPFLYALPYQYRFSLSCTPDLHSNLYFSQVRKSTTVYLPLCEGSFYSCDHYAMKLTTAKWPKDQSSLHMCPDP